MPACPPLRLIALCPIACSAITIMVLETISPVDIRTSISLSSGVSLI